MYLLPVSVVLLTLMLKYSRFKVLLFINIYSYIKENFVKENFNFMGIMVENT